MEKIPTGKEKFVVEHLGEIGPVVRNDPEKSELIREIEKSEDPSPIFEEKEEEIDKILERFETKVYFLEKPEKEYSPGARRILLSASNPSYFSLMNPLVERLKKDRRCQAIGLITDNVAGRDFEKLFDEKKDDGFKILKGGSEYETEKGADDGYNKDVPVFQDVLKMVKDKPFDIVLTAFEAINSPSSGLFFGGKSIFGAKKLFVIKAGWTGSSGRLDLVEKADKMDSIDAILCNDTLAKEITAFELPDYPKEKILITGTPTTDSLEINRAAEYQRVGREKLGIEDNEVAVLYLGDNSKDYEQIDPEADENINEKTFQKTLDALKEAAIKEPQKRFVLMVRPHPRANLSISNEITPANLRIVRATNDIISMQESGYSADIVMSICSNENNIAPLRGKQAVFLGYSDSGLGGNSLKKIFGSELLEVLNKSEGISVISSFDEMVDYLRKSSRSEEIKQLLSEPNDSIKKILDVILKEKE